MSFPFTLYDALVGIEVPPDKAKAVIDALERDMGATLASKNDILVLKQDLSRDVDPLRREIEQVGHEIEQVRHEIGQVRHEIGQVRHETEQVRREVDQLRKDVARDLELLRASMTVRLGSIQVVTVGLLFAALRLT